LKIAPLLAQYLYIHKRMDLPGFGTFLLDPSVTIEPENNRQNKPSNLEGVSFENNSAITDATDLIKFISTQTGKIKALAAADLDSHLGLAQQFLNIGKPFLLEGIGSLVKLKSGEFTFTSGHAMPGVMKDYQAKEVSAATTTEEPFTDYKSTFYTRKGKSKWNKPVVFLLLLAGIALAIGGGYTVYKRTTAKNNADPVKEEKQETILVQDTALHQKDTVIEPKQMTAITAGNYKFVIEIAARERGLARFAKLKSFGLNVQMQTTDSINFKLFFILPATIADTARMIDSLRGIYTPSGNKAYIEN
jgi:hypothetical protein